MFQTFIYLLHWGIWPLCSFSKLHVLLQLTQVGRRHVLCSQPIAVSFNVKSIPALIYPMITNITSSSSSFIRCTECNIFYPWTHNSTIDFDDMYICKSASHNVVILFAWLFPSYIKMWVYVCLDSTYSQGGNNSPNHDLHNPDLLHIIQSFHDCIAWLQMGLHIALFGNHGSVHVKWYFTCTDVLHLFTLSCSLHTDKCSDAVHHVGRWMMDTARVNGGIMGFIVKIVALYKYKTVFHILYI